MIGIGETPNSSLRAIYVFKKLPKGSIGFEQLFQWQGAVTFAIEVYGICEGRDERVS